MLVKLEAARVNEPMCTVVGHSIIVANPLIGLGSITERTRINQVIVNGFQMWELRPWRKMIYMRSCGPTKIIIKPIAVSTSRSEIFS
ncbi:MAG: hypothetical protein OXM00_05390 [Paracoccaceae bacterium]|nr:hypothetical protein [Paracoccaceae bacterium]